MIFIMMVGLPGSGKTFQAKVLSEKYGATVLSSDKYRKMYLGSEEVQSNNDLVFRKMHTDLSLLLSQNKNVIYDATNITLKSRKTALDIVKKYKNCEKIAYIMNATEEICIQNDANRNRSVGEEVIRRMEKQFQIPMKYEGFDEIVLHNPIKDYSLFDTLEIRREMSDFNQKNPHHLYSLYDHCAKLAAYYSPLTLRWRAALWHDVGKLFTQEIDKDGIAHYIGHDSYGTYFLLTHTEILNTHSLEELLEILWLVNFHMRFHNDYMGEKARKKYTILFGEERFKSGEKFAEYDKMASGTYVEQ